LKLFYGQAIKGYGGLEAWILSFLNLALEGDEGSDLCPDCFDPGERASDIHSAEDLEVPRANLDILK
jgi:hypothetical protein